MANKDASFGLKLIGHHAGAPYSARVRSYYIASTYATALYVGDPVIVTSTSNTAVVSTGIEKHGIGTLPEIEKATAGSGNKIAGVIVGFEPIIRSGTAPYNPASTARVAKVCDDPNALYLIQADGSIAATDVNYNAAVVYTNAGSTATGLSGVELNAASVATTATEQLKILGNADIPGRNTFGSNWPVLVVKINNHHYGNVVVGV